MCIYLCSRSCPLRTPFVHLSSPDPGQEGPSPGQQGNCKKLTVVSQIVFVGEEKQHQQKHQKYAVAAAQFFQSGPWLRYRSSFLPSPFVFLQAQCKKREVGHQKCTNRRIACAKSTNGGPKKGARKKGVRKNMRSQIVFQVTFCINTLRSQFAVCAATAVDKLSSKRTFSFPWPGQQKKPPTVSNPLQPQSGRGTVLLPGSCTILCSFISGAQFLSKATG